jgi:Fe2+ transport system protein B
MRLEYATLVNYLRNQNSECSVDDLRMGVKTEALMEKYIINDTHEALEKYGELVLKNISENPFYYYGMIDKLRKPKFLGMAIFDIVMTIIAILFIVALTNKSFATVGAGVFMLAILTHWYFGIETQFGYYLGLNQQMRSIL